MSQLCESIDERSVKLCIEKFLENINYQSPLSLFTQNTNSLVKKYGKNRGQHTYPYKLFWKITSKCNLKCKHCYFYNNESKLNSNNDLPDERIMQLVKEISDMEVLNLILTGGEIFTRSDIFQIIKMFKSQNIPLSLSTNATLINEEMVKQLKQYLHPQIDNIQVSLDGAFAKTHDKIRGKGNFDKAVKGIKLLTNAELPVTINTTVTAYNVNEITDLYKLAHNLNVNKISYSKFTVVNEEHEKIVTNQEAVTKQIANVISLEKELKTPFVEKIAMEFFDLVNLPNSEKFLNKYIDKIPKQANYDCSCQNGNKGYIDSQGDVYLCHLAANNPKYAIGNLKEKTFAKVWADKDSNVLFQPRNSCEMSCKDCKYIPLCKCGCAYDVLEQSRNILSKNAKCKYSK